MEVQHYTDEVIAVTSSDGPGPVVIEWCEEEPSGVRCDGWIEGDELFAPSDGQASPGYWLTDGEPDADGHWYHVESGTRAIIGVPGATLSRFPV